MKTMIIYFSQTGFTKRYAHWLAEELGCECVPFEKRREVKLSEYDAVVFGSWLHVGAIRKVKWFKKQMSRLKGKKIVFAVGSMPGNADDAIAEMFAKNFTEDERSQLQLFYMQGGLDYAKMGRIDRMMMNGLKKMLTGKKQRTPEDEGMLRMIEKDFDGTDRNAIAPVVAAVRGEEK